MSESGSVVCRKTINLIVGELNTLLRVTNIVETHYTNNNNYYTVRSKTELSEHLFTVKDRIHHWFNDHHVNYAVAYAVTSCTLTL